MGLDVGTKNIGVSLSDETRTIARGEEVVRRVSDSAAIDRIGEIIKKFEVKEVIVGLPINMNGTMGERADDSVKFAEKLKGQTGVSVKLWDERLSTKEAEHIMISASVTRKKRKQVVDKFAAQIILQGYLDSLETKGDRY